MKIIKLMSGALACCLVIFTGTVIAQSEPQGSARLNAPSQPRTLDGSGNHPNNHALGMMNTVYKRLVAADYADDIGEMVERPNTRYISNRIFNDNAQNIFSENQVTQWAAAWGQFVDHSIGLRDQGEGENAPIAFDPFDPLEEYQNDLGVISFTRTRAAQGTGIDSPREQLNIVSSWLDAWAVYGGTDDRLEWLREGPVDGDLTNNSARLLTTNSRYLPRATARGDAESAPSMELVGGLRLAPQTAVITGDVRANENIALTAIQTLFVREHNRIVDHLPDSLTEEEKFQIARRVVGAMQQHITYTEFLPSLGVTMKPYRGYRPNVDPGISNEFATVGYRAHSMIHGEIELDVAADAYTTVELAALEERGVEVEHSDEGVGLAIPLNTAFANPDLVEMIGLGRLLSALAGESQYNNDEQIDNQLRSVMFQIPRPEATRPADCFDGVTLPDCYSGVTDLGALDIERGRDHGIGSYNELRKAFGLRPAVSFTDITGEDTDEFPVSIVEASDAPVDDPDTLKFTELRDIDGNLVEPGTDAAEGEVVRAVRHTTIAARLKAIYGIVDNVDAFVGMVAEPHVPGTEFGLLQLRMWQKQFEDLRDGDRYFYANDPVLNQIRRRYGISYKRRLSQVVAANTTAVMADMPRIVFTARSTRSRGTTERGSRSRPDRLGSGGDRSRGNRGQ